MNDRNIDVRSACNLFWTLTPTKNARRQNVDRRSHCTCSWVTPAFANWQCESVLVTQKSGHRRSATHATITTKFVNSSLTDAVFARANGLLCADNKRPPIASGFSCTALQLCSQPQLRAVGSGVSGVLGARGQKQCTECIIVLVKCRPSTHWADVSAVMLPFCPARCCMRFFVYFRKLQLLWDK